MYWVALCNTGEELSKANAAISCWVIDFREYREQDCATQVLTWGNLFFLTRRPRRGLVDIDD